MRCRCLVTDTDAAMSIMRWFGGHSRLGDRPIVSAGGVVSCTVTTIESAGGLAQGIGHAQGDRVRAERERHGEGLARAEQSLSGQAEILERLEERDAIPGAGESSWGPRNRSRRARPSRRPGRCTR